MLDFTDIVFKLQPIAEREIIKDVMPMLLEQEQIIAPFKSGRDQVIFTDKRIIAVDVKGITGSRKEFSTLPYAKIVRFTVQTAGFLELNKDSELYLFYPDGEPIKFEFSSGSVDILRITKTISNYVL